MPARIRNPHGEALDFATHGWVMPDRLVPAADRPAAEQFEPPERVAVIAHGVTSSKDRPWLVALADALAAADVPALRVTYSGNGESEGRFDECTLSKEAEDLGSVLDALAALGVRRAGYIGHSMGAAVGVLRAARDPRIRCLVSLAGMVHVHAFMQRHFGHLTPGRDLMLDKPGCVWNAALAADAARIGSLTPQASLVQVPWLLVHGDADEMVPLQDSHDAREAAGDRPTLVTLAGVDHRFTGAIPLVVAAVVPWVGRRL